MKPFGFGIAAPFVATLNPPTTSELDVAVTDAETEELMAEFPEPETIVKYGPTTSKTIIFINAVEDDVTVTVRDVVFDNGVRVENI